MAQLNLGAAGIQLGPGGGVPLGPGLPLPAAGHGLEARTYQEYYLERGNVPPPERVAAYLAGYRFTDVGGAGVPAPIALRDLTVTLSDRQSMAFLCLIPGVDGLGEVSIIHRFVRYMDNLGDDPTGFNDRVFGLLGDLLPYQYPVVEVPNTSFHLVGTPVRVPTVEAMTALLPTWEDPLQALGPYVEQDPETEVVRPRHLQLVPGRLAAILVHRRRVRAKQAYQELYGVIQAEGGLDAYADVLAWLRAACTARGGGGAQNTVPSVMHAFAPIVHLPPEVYGYMAAKVQGDLPALATRADTGGTTEALLGAIRALSAPRGRAADEAEGDPGAREPKSVADTYRETYRTLLRFGNVDNVNELAPVWHRLANCHKSEQHVVLTQEFHKVCMSRGLSTEYYSPIVTTSLKQMVVGLQFIGHGPDDLSSGCQPFLVSYSGTTNHYQAVAAADEGNQLARGDQNANLADYRVIREKEKVKFPRDATETAITLCRYAVLTQVLFQGTGARHPFVEAMWATAVGLQNLAPSITERYQSLSRTPGVAQTYFARIVRAVQLGVHDYFQQVAVNVAESVFGVELPSFALMLQDLKRGTFHQSTNWIAIPDDYMAGTTSLPTAGGSRVSGGPLTVVTGASVSTGVSSITHDTTRDSVARVENPNGDSEFTSLTLRAGGTRAILRAHRPPTNDAGHEFCVAWWTRSGCYPNCGRRNTHQPFASAAERARLLAYVRQHLVAPASSTA
ncbi:hypothetical protein MHU86_12630 [Fragilaria crotonensis]|nr:hypothetical protein MHU86_12630 [Fragilaria crotonensis]